MIAVMAPIPFIIPSSIMLSLHSLVFVLPGGDLFGVADPSGNAIDALSDRWTSSRFVVGLLEATRECGAGLDRDRGSSRVPATDDVQVRRRVVETLAVLDLQGRVAEPVLA